MNISVEKAKQIREDIGATHLILFARAEDGEENVSTHGLTEQQAHEAADTGNRLKKLLGWPEALCQSTPQQRAEWNRKTATEIMADIERLMGNKQRNELGRQALLREMQEQPARREEFEREYASLKRRAEDYEVRVQALEWVLARPYADLQKERQEVFVDYLVPVEQVKDFDTFLNGYDDDQRDAQVEADREHYEQWLDTADPGDEYTGRSENDPGSELEESVWMVSEAATDYGYHKYRLGFRSSLIAFTFAFYWGRLLEREQVAEGQAYPEVLTPELDEALGWPNFKCGPYAEIFRAAGHDIPTKAEREQAFVLHWLTGLVLKHGAEWKQQASAELTALREKIEQKGEQGK